MKKITKATETRLSKSNEWLASEIANAIEIHRNIAALIEDGYDSDNEYQEFYDNFGISISGVIVNIKSTTRTPEILLRNIPKIDGVEYNRLMTGFTHIRINDINNFVKTIYA